MIRSLRRGAAATCALALFLAFPAGAAGPDQTEDLALVAAFLARLRVDGPAGASRYLTGNAVIADLRSGEARSLDQFADYARFCLIREVGAVPGHYGRDSRRMPIGASWSCRYPEKDRTASFWLEGDRIRRITFGPPMVIKVPSLPPPPRPRPRPR